jgi:glycosyltransferase involved in cell wall biosynthesis
MRYPVVDRLVLQRFDALIAGATDIKDYLISYGQNSSRIHVVHNWVDFSKRKPSSSVLDTRKKLGAGGQIIIGCIGRLHPQKGQIYLIRAFPKVLAEYPDTMLMLVGDGETRGVLEKEVTLLGLAEKVVFTGTAIGDEYNNFIAAIDIYVQPSLFEGLPRTLLDAMYMGKAIVATDINGNKEAIKHEVNGLLVPSEDSAKLSDAILELLRDPVKIEKYSSSATNYAQQNFGMDRQLEKIEHVIAAAGG